MTPNSVTDEERPTGAAPLSVAHYRGVMLSAGWRDRLAAIEADEGNVTAGPLLHLLARISHRHTTRLAPDPLGLRAWIASALWPEGDGPSFPAAGSAAPADIVVGADPVSVADGGWWVGATQERPDDPLWRVVPLGDGLALAGRVERLPRYRESERERFIALVLAAMQPATLHLGPDVVFDATAKPAATRVQFSGMGGPIGRGELLISHPESIQRYSPQPGAVALLLAPPLTPPRSDHAALRLGDEELLLVVV